MKPLPCRTQSSRRRHAAAALKTSRLIKRRVSEKRPYGATTLTVHANGEIEWETPFPGLPRPRGFFSRLFSRRDTDLDIETRRLTREILKAQHKSAGELNALIAEDWRAAGKS